MRKTILIALLLPSLAMAELTASQASFLEYKQCVSSAVQVPGADGAQPSFIAAARSQCAALRARLSTDIIAELRSEGRPESMARRIAEDAIKKLESGLHDDLARPVDGTR